MKNSFYDDDYHDDVANEQCKRDRVDRCYRDRGGPLLGWLADEARSRGQGVNDMALELGVTGGYIHQLRGGHRHVHHISDGFARACARYLGVPAIVIKLLSGRVSVSDFLSPLTDSTTQLDRAWRRMLADPSVRERLPVDLDSLSDEARKALVLMYVEVSQQDLVGVRQLPMLLAYLQRAAVVHDENEERASRSTAP